MQSSPTRSSRIDFYLKQYGLKRLAREFGVREWSVQKWRNLGAVPNSRLQEFCLLTGAHPSEVCDPDLDFIFTFATPSILPKVVPPSIGGSGNLPISSTCVRPTAPEKRMKA